VFPQTFPSHGCSTGNGAGSGRGNGARRCKGGWRPKALGGVKVFSPGKAFIKPGSSAELGELERDYLWTFSASGE